MPEPIPAPATTPTPSPSPDPSPTPTPTPTPEPAKVPSWESDLDKLGEDLTPPAKPAKSEPAKPDPKPDKAPAKDAQKPADKPADKPAADDEPAEIKTSNISQLRKWATERHKAARALETEKQQLQAKLQQLETVVPKTQQEGVVMTEAMAAMQKQIAEYEKALATHVFEQSPKYVNDYQKPFMAARDKAYRSVEELLVNEPTGELDEEGNPKIKQRQATKRDFDYIYSLPRAQARQEARKLFGDDADEVMEHRRNLSDLAEKAIEAVENHKKNYAEETKAAMARQTQERNATAQLWRTANEKISADPRFQALWGNDADDPESNDALSNGFKMADVFFSEERDKLNPQDKVLFDANIRHRIAGFSRLAYKVKKLQGELNAANATIEELRGSAPGKPLVDGGKPKTEVKTWSEGIDALPE